ncbi:transposase family protein [Streptomyces sp. WAC 04229]|uniref:transposase family protein n=1 Tax=Streptomyces sp. WAC 04229 TaxID=2203206 RepID=UPI003D710898
MTTTRDAEVKCWADKAYQGTDGIIRVPFRGWRLKLRQRRHNSTHARIRCLGEQTMDALKDWRLPRRLRCSTNRVAAIVEIIPALRHAST